AHWQPNAPVEGSAQFEASYGGTILSGSALASQRHMHEYGTTSAQLALNSVGGPGNAGNNPAATARTPATHADSPPPRATADPPHRADACAIAEGGGALLMTTAERARALPRPPITVRSTGSAQTHWNISTMRAFTTTAATTAGSLAFRRAGLSPQEVDVLL